MFYACRLHGPSTWREDVAARAADAEHMPKQSVPKPQAVRVLRGRDEVTRDLRTMRRLGARHESQASRPTLVEVTSRVRRWRARPAATRRRSACFRRRSTRVPPHFWRCRVTAHSIVVLLVPKCSANEPSMRFCLLPGGDTDASRAEVRLSEVCCRALLKTFRTGDRAFGPVRPYNVRRLSCSEAPRACGQSGTPPAADSRTTRLAGGVTPCVSEDKRGFSPERGERPAASCWQ
jgi:hypothetical protein